MVAEALACGVPVIAAPIGLVPELVHHGENGFLSEWQVAQWAEQLLSLQYPMVHARLAAAAPAAAQPFSQETVLTAYALGLRGCC